MKSHKSYIFCIEQKKLLRKYLTIQESYKIEWTLYL